MNWINLTEDSSNFPDWKDSEREVELQKADGSIITGKLFVEDFVGGEDEVPIFAVRLPNNETQSIFEFEKFRFLGK